MIHPLADEIRYVEESYRAGKLSVGERDYLITEIKDVRAAQECADNEEMIRDIVALCEVVLAIP